MLDRAGEQAVIVDEQIANLQSQADEDKQNYPEASLRSDITDEQLGGLVVPQAKEATQRPE